MTSGMGDKDSALRAVLAKAVYEALESTAVGSPFLGGFEPVTVIDGERDGGSVLDGRFDLEAAAGAVLAALKSSGLAIVPVEPTQEMVEQRLATRFTEHTNGWRFDVAPNSACRDVIVNFDRHQLRDIYRAMLQAAPTT